MDLKSKRCQAYEGKTAALAEQALEPYLTQCPQWSLSADKKIIQRQFEFKNYFHTIAFVNAIAWIAHQQNHHPDLQVSYNRCTVMLTTHAIGGLSENDFIVAAQIDTLQE